MMARKQDTAPREPLLEWIAAGIGLILTLAILVVIGREAVSGETETAAAIHVEATSVAQVPSGFVVEIVARNASGATAAAVEIEGVLKSGETEVETSGLTLDYVPGNAKRKGGLFFSKDPRNHKLEVRALGYQRP
jgi:uncharacterized protein (TIGR02588 family)